jgi:hypothetical protein
MLLWQLKKFLESRKSNEIKFPHSRLPASFHFAVFLKVFFTFLSGLPFFALLKTSSLTSTRGVPKASTIPRCGIAGRFYLFAFSSELESP